MSLRNMRKVFGNPSLPPPGSDDEDDYEPLYAKALPHKYEGLTLSSSSEAEEAQDSPDAATPPEKPINKGTVKKKQKKKKNKKMTKAGTSSKENEELDEIDRSLMEVNALLGAPPAAPSPPPPARDSPEAALFTVQQKHLNVTNELKRLFGDDEKKKRGRNTDLQRLMKKSVIVPIPESIMRITKVGLSMSVLRREEGATYFVLNHSRDYQHMQRTLMVELIDLYDQNLQFSIDELVAHMHVEAMLEIADAMFRSEEVTSANTMVEQAIACMQYISLPAFSLTDRKTRLEYLYLENRPFHVALLKYAYLVSNRACHRTGLEIAKLLLNLDPTDPLAVLFVIDTFALRAREHDWLIRAVEYWRRTRDAKYLFNLQYSYAMALYHVANNSPEAMEKADAALETAIWQFPTVVPRLLECASVTHRLREHPLYASEGEAWTSKSLKDLIYLYAKLTWSKWKEPGVIEWLKRTAEVVAHRFDTDPAMKTHFHECGVERLTLFRSWPPQITRHLAVISPMSQLLVDGAVPFVKQSRSCDPQPSTPCVDRYKYQTTIDSTEDRLNPLYELFASILPHYRWPANTVGVNGDGPEQPWPAEPPPRPGARRPPRDRPDDDDDYRPEAAGGDNSQLIVSVSDLTDAVRRFIDVYEEATRTGPSVDQSQRTVDEVPSLGQPQPPVDQAQPSVAQSQRTVDEVPSLGQPQPPVDQAQPSVDQSEPSDDLYTQRNR